MSSVFTEYVASLAPGAGEISPEQFARVWNGLRSALARELERRGLWHTPPSYLGVYGWSSWAAAGAEGVGGEASHRQGTTAIDELVAACYEFIFIDRLRSLRAQLDSKPTLDGLIHRNIKNFLYDTQKRHDPVGFRVFQLLRRSVREMLGASELYLVAGDARVRNETVLAFAPHPGTTALSAGLEAQVRTWSETLWPPLSERRGGAVDEVVSLLKRRIAALEPAGILRFRFRELVAPLRDGVRRRWAEELARQNGKRVFAAPLGENGGEAGALDPGMVELEDREAFAELVARMDRSLETLDESPTTRRYLRSLLAFLADHAAGPSSEGDKRELPSQRRLALLLSIPRDRLPGLLRTLGGLSVACRDRGSLGLLLDEGRSDQRARPQLAGER